MFLQENAWVGTKVAVDWVKKILKSAAEHFKRFVLFADNLTGQDYDGFKESVSYCSGFVWYGLPNATDVWQPVDPGYGNEESYSAKERRIFITHWAGEACTKVCGNEYDDFRKKF